MPRRLLQLEPGELGGVHRRAREEFGPDAVVVAVEKVTVGGIAGFLARQHYEVTVEVPDAPAAVVIPASGESHRLDVPARLGIAALLAEADDEEVRISGRADARAPAFPAAPVVSVPVVSVPVVSTASAMFDDLMRSLALDEAQIAPPLPTLRSNPGDLVVLVGLRRDPLTVAQSLTSSLALASPSGSSGPRVRVGGSVDGVGNARVDTRRDALEARAQGVRDGCAVIVAIGVSPGRPDVTADLVRTLAPDQVWVVVDATRKADDTASWVSNIAAVVPLDAMAVLGRDETATPESVDALGLPVAWVDGEAVTRVGSARR